MRCACSLSRQERELIQRRGTSNAEAYDLYLRGQAHLRDGTDTEMNPAIEFFREAIRRDERFAQAHAGIANAQSIKGLWRVGMTQADFDEAFAASRRALELEPRMPEAYIARAMLLSLQGRDDEACQDFEEAIRLNPASFDAHYLYARHRFQGGEFERAVPLYEEAIRLRPDDYQALCLLEGSLLKLGRTEQHARWRAARCRRSIGSSPSTRRTGGRCSSERRMRRGSVCGKRRVILPSVR